MADNPIREPEGAARIAELTETRPESVRLDLVVLKVNELIRKANGGISRGDASQQFSRVGDHDAQYITWLFTAHDVPYQIPHGLGRLPTGYKVVRRNMPGDVYDALPGSWGLKSFWLQAEMDGMNVVLEVW